MTEVRGPAPLTAEEHGTLEERHTAGTDEAARFRALPASAAAQCPAGAGLPSSAGIPPALLAASALKLCERLLNRDGHRRGLVAVHGLQRLRLHRHLSPGEEFASTAVVRSVRPLGAAVASEVSVRFATGAGESVAESTSLLVHGPPVNGPGAPAGGSAASAPARPVPPAGASSYNVTRELVARYADLSGDRNPIHLSPAAAHAGGFEDVVAHGMLTFALAGHHVAARRGESRIADLQLRFSRPLFVPSAGAVLTVSDRTSPGEGEGAPKALALTATDGSGTVIASGRAALLPQDPASAAGSA